MSRYHRSLEVWYARVQMKGIHRFVDGYQRHAQNRCDSERALLQALAQRHEPEALVISCSDSRVIPERITSADPGALFVVRNVGNLVPPVSSGNQSVAAALAYGIEHLHIPHLVVLGHQGCGAMAAVRDLALSARPPADPALPGWLVYGRDSWDELVAEGLDQAPDWHDRLVEENVLQQLANALGYPVVSRAVDEGRLALHAWVYDLHVGALRFWDGERRDFVAEAAGAGAISRDEVEREDTV